MDVCYNKRLHDHQKIKTHSQDCIVKQLFGSELEISSSWGVKVVL